MIEASSRQRSEWTWQIRGRIRDQLKIGMRVRPSALGPKLFPLLPTSTLINTSIERIGADAHGERGCAIQNGRRAGRRSSRPPYPAYAATDPTVTPCNVRLLLGFTFFNVLIQALPCPRIFPCSVALRLEECPQVRARPAPAHDRQGYNFREHRP